MRQLPTFIPAAALILSSWLLLQYAPQRSEISGTRWYAEAGARPLFADCAYRFSIYLEDLDSTLHLGEEGPIHDLQERAVGDYERQALRGRLPSAIAANRLGAVYARRGYTLQAKAMFMRAARLDEARAQMYFAAAAVYDPATTNLSYLRSLLSALDMQEPWVRDMILPDYYRRLGDEATATEAEARWHQEQARFGVGFITIFAVYLLLGLVGIAVMARGLLMALARTQPPPARAPFFPRWQPADVVLALAICVFAVIALGSGLGVLRNTPFGARSSPLSEALVALTSYLCFAGIGLFVVRRYADRPGSSWLTELGLARKGAARGIGVGIMGYGVLVALFVIGNTLFDGGVTLEPGAAEVTDGLLRSLHQPAVAAIFLFLLCVAAPIVEELIFRGFAYAGLRRHLTPSGAALVSAGAFACIHVGAPAGGLVIVFLIGLLLANLYERQRSLWPCIAAHALHNLLFFAITMLQAW